MSQGCAYQTGQQQGSNTTSGDYHDYISTLSKMPSIIHGAPQYPSVHKAFNNKVSQEEEVNGEADGFNQQKQKGLNCANGRPSNFP
ncbi:hypothetical protein NC651_027760 [Populus alba x Populus x berolinensis]|nr:hypothetical protein NC651_027760 [Populus alba x Populus x berolinensis]